MKTVDVSETITACDLKVGRCRKLIELMKMYEYIQVQGHYLTLDQGHLHMKIKTGFSPNQVGHFELNFVCKLLGTWKLKFYDIMVVTRPRWPPCPYMLKTLSNLLLQNH